jgi:CRISPR-associated protein Csd1
VGDTTVVFWAASPKSIYQDCVSFALNPPETEAELADDGASSDLIGKLFKNIAEGKAVSDFENVFDSSVRFYIWVCRRMPRGFRFAFLFKTLSGIYLRG